MRWSASIASHRIVHRCRKLANGEATLRRRQNVVGAKSVRERALCSAATNVVERRDTSYTAAGTPVTPRTNMVGRATAWMVVSSGMFIGRERSASSANRFTRLLTGRKLSVANPACDHDGGPLSPMHYPAHLTWRLPATGAAICGDRARCRALALRPLVNPLIRLHV